MKKQLQPNTCLIKITLMNGAVYYQKNRFNPKFNYFPSGNLIELHLKDFKKSWEKKKNVFKKIQQK